MQIFFSWCPQLCVDLLLPILSLRVTLLLKTSTACATSRLCCCREYNSTIIVKSDNVFIVPQPYVCLHINKYIRTDKLLPTLNRVMFFVIWPFCVTDAVFDSQVYNSEAGSGVYNSCSCSIYNNSSPWYRSHAASRVMSVQ